MAKQHIVKLSAPEIRHILGLLWESKIDGGYYGPREQHAARQDRLIEKVKEVGGRCLSTSA